ncbi:tRNA (guanosine(46)-N7)-methyltransferase TrmB [Flammeovirga kamogawensis]|uniref:tRNA (guanine-N(7)-)-methyltransferase n=1 Tax=Flammeovirga kamogawensis TaxID=373891 RepID=A0ABX8GRA4_9BACT|nr:tRNA (guanosine(46)-N7)-methyltransferase TrmB [Flammeovirga kamogawensis]MBB6463173.1 tRNA (guanine-N7-)-methyltransferase [Flammeovirga kamogawensis]QWG05973.1 tRNA (guanosine(46)-N7)-methyltransferase TrmB [Flammeovirga kamogawensis]TRX67800.1 tRNA (guanosine(46)-N7)-methyltransferase TrmB [Flammeovirga kamogawensis]
MGRRKLIKFEENNNRAYVIEEGKPLYETIKGNWRKEVFKNENPLVLELACGRGEYTTGLAQVYPDKNFIGIDIKGDRIWKGGNVVDEKGLTNAAFLRTHIQNLEKYFEKGEVDEIWIIHPDPRPKDRDAKRRMTHPRFLNIYKNLLKENGLVRFKTDSKELFEYSVETLVEQKVQLEAITFDLYESKLLKEHHGIVTRYEKHFTELGHKVHYLKFRFNK